jgi:hypothetical protein
MAKPRVDIAGVPLRDCGSGERFVARRGRSPGGGM